MAKTTPQEIQIKDFDYDLPDERIAKYPLEKRDSSKLLVYKSGKIEDSRFESLPDFLPPKAMLIRNNTKVIQARMIFQKETGARVEIFCLEPNSPVDYLSSFQQTESCTWLCLVGNSKKWKDGELYKHITVDTEQTRVSIERSLQIKDASLIHFSWDNPKITFADILDSVGELPIPPYLNRETEEKDKDTYQTIYSKIIGSVAAPTAGLHFTDDVLIQLANKGIKTDEVTLHVGAGTFKPVQSVEIGSHEMHSELISVRKDLIKNLLDNLGNIIAVGTTSVRTLESLYYIGAILGQDVLFDDLFVPQWMPYDDEINISVSESLNNIIDYLERNNLESLIAHTAIMIAPSYKFKIVNGIVTNFHQPQSTLLLLVSAFIDGGDWKHIYNHALENEYRFLSYGDSSLLLR